MENLFMRTFNREPQLYIHGSKLRRKAEGNDDLRAAFESYTVWRTRSLEITGRERDDVYALVDLLNQYKDTVELIFDARPNSAQEVLQPSILEEFFEYLFCRVDEVIGEGVLRRPASGYLDLIFNPRDIHTLVSNPEYTIRRKDHDFVIGSTINLTIRAEGTHRVSEDQIVIPAVALECKRYLERNMLDECSGTAEKIKRATPYCIYIVVAEYLKMDDCSPELSRIDEIYVLRKQRNLERGHVGFIPNPIDRELVWDIYQKIVRHLRRIWWNPDSALTTGKLFNFE
jgi:hypothetical protein